MKFDTLRQVVVLKWSDGSRNLFLTGDFEMEDFILWKQSKNPDLTFETEVMSLTEYKTQYN
jgi:hypothetical protein